MKILNLLIAFILVFSVNAQDGKLKRADKYFKVLSYTKAATQYEELLGSSVDSPKMKSKLAYCYFQMGDMVKAESTYAQVVSTPDVTSEDLYNYAQALKENKKYDESDKWMKAFTVKAPDDFRTKDFLSKGDYLSRIKGQGEYFVVKNLDVNTALTDFGGYPSVDEKDIYFMSSRQDLARNDDVWTWNNDFYLEMYKGQRETNMELSNANKYSKKINTRFHEGPICFAKDGKTVFYTRNNISKGKMRKDTKGVQNLKIYISEVDAEGNWIREREFKLNSKDYSVGHPTISPDGKTLYFVSDMPGGMGGSDIYKMAILEGGNFGEAQNLGKGINTEAMEMFPWIAEDGTFFFSSDGLVGLGGLDVFVILPLKDGSFGEIINAGMPLNSNKDDFAFVMLKDGQHGYFSSNRETGKGMDDIYSFTLTKPFKKVLSLEGIAMDATTKQPLANTEITFKSPTGEPVKVTTGADGSYSFPLEPDLAYNLVGELPDYFSTTEKISTANLSSDVSVIKKDLLLEKDPGISLYALVTESKGKLPLEGVKMTILDNKTKANVLDLTTPITGDASKGLAGKKIGESVSYTIQLEKEGYFPKTIQFNYTIKEPGIIKINEALAGALVMDAEVKDLRDLVQINDIRFDLNKDFIRPDAAKELDKVVAVMNKYPNMVIELGSHTDCRSSYKYNEDLSDRRAKNSAKYIKARITNPDRIYGKGYGEYRLLNDCKCEGAVKSTCTNEQHDVNRRTEFKIIAVGTDKVDVINTSTQSFDKK